MRVKNQKKNMEKKRGCGCLRAGPAQSCSPTGEAAYVSRQARYRRARKSWRWIGNYAFWVWCFSARVPWSPLFESFKNHIPKYEKKQKMDMCVNCQEKIHCFTSYTKKLKSLVLYGEQCRFQDHQIVGFIWWTCSIHPYDIVYFFQNIWKHWNICFEFFKKQCSMEIGHQNFWLYIS